MKAALRGAIGKITLAVLVLAGAVILSKTFNYSVDEQQQEEQYVEHIESDYNIYSLPTPKHLDFCGEIVPLEDVDVRERLDRELLVNTYWQSQTLLFHKRAHRWFPVIEPILKANGLPDDFKYLALIESGFQNVVSPAGATGFWQFMKGTGKSYQLEITDEVDERYHVEKSTAAACQYLQIAYDKFGSWTLAAASYNMGKGGLNSRLNEQQADNYYDLLLNEETARYVYRILAIKEILTHSEQYGFNVRKQDMYPTYKTKEVVVDTTINNLVDFAISQNISYKTLKLLNPWLRQQSLTNVDSTEYRIKIPAEGFHDFLAPEPIDTAKGDTL